MRHQAVIFEIDKKEDSGEYQQILQTHRRLWANKKCYHESALTLKLFFDYVAEFHRL